MASYTITHESAVPTSASCLMRPTMTYPCMRCSLQSEHEHTLCCAESARMYILHMRIKVLGKQNGQSGLWLLTPSIIHFKFISPPYMYCIRDFLLFTYLTWNHLPRAWIRSQTSWLRRKRCTGDVNLHLHLAPRRMVTALY